MDERTGFDLKPIFDQFLRDTRIPVLEYRFIDGSLMYRWGNAVRGYNMPVKVYLDGKETWLPNNGRRWNVLPNIKPCELVVDKDFYVSSFNLMGE